MTAENNPRWAPDIEKPGRTPQAEPPGEQEAWDEVIPLGSRLVPPPFPLASLPAWLQNIITAVAEETQTAPDIAATFALGGLSTAAGGKAVVRFSRARARR